MAHEEQLNFIKTIKDEIKTSNFKNLKVLEIGSYGSGAIRKIFNVDEHKGFDLTMGPGVDFIYDGINLDLKDEVFDIVVSCECFEHDPNWENTFKNMIKYTKSEGIVIVTCASRGRVEHGTFRSDPTHSPGTNAIGINHYRNLVKSDFERSFDLNSIFEDHFFINQKTSKDLYFIGIVNSKNQINSKVKIDLSNLQIKVINNQKLIKNKRMNSLKKIIMLILRDFDLPLKKILLLQKSESLYQLYMLTRRKLLLKISNQDSKESS